jgi:hypothetical protein
MAQVQPQPLAIGLCLLALGCVAPLSSDDTVFDRALAPASVETVAVGSRVSVAGLVGDVQAFPSGAASADLLDCRGSAARVYFPPGVAAPPAWTLAVVVGQVQLYRGARELVAEASVGAGLATEAVDVEGLANDPGARACRPVSFSAKVLGSTGSGSVLSVQVEGGVSAPSVTVHVGAAAAVECTPGARVNFVGVPAQAPDGTWTVHVRT